MRTTILAVLTLTIPTGADAQGERELEFGGGLHSAQERTNEIEVGGGFHAGLDIADFIQFPSVPTLDMRFVHWRTDQWGVAGRVLLGIGSDDSGDYSVEERRNPGYLQVLARYRFASLGKTTLYAGIGGGVLWFGDTPRSGFGGPAEDRFQVWPHLLALEALVSRTITERLSLRGGVTLVPLIHLHPVVLVAYKW